MEFVYREVSNCKNRKWPLALLVLAITFTTMSISEAKQPKDCGTVELAQNGTPYPVLCPDGSPNSNAYEFIADSRLLGLSKGASAAKIKDVICEELYNSTNQIEIAIYSYVFALNDWQGKRISPDSLSNNIMNGSFCVENSGTKSSSKSTLGDSPISPPKNIKSLDDLNEWTSGVREGARTLFEGEAFGLVGKSNTSVQKFCSKFVKFNLSKEYFSRIFWSSVFKKGFFAGCTFAN